MTAKNKPAAAAPAPVPPSDSNAVRAKIYGENLRKLREAHGLTQAQYAKIIHSKQPTVSRVEEGGQPSGPFIAITNSYFRKSVQWMETEHEPHEYLPDKPIDPGTIEKIRTELKIELLQDQLRECHAKLAWYDTKILEHLQKDGTNG